MKKNKELVILYKINKSTDIKLKIISIGSFLILLAAKLNGFIDSWLLVFSPFWIPFLMTLFLFMIGEAILMDGASMVITKDDAQNKDDTTIQS